MTSGVEGLAFVGAMIGVRQKAFNDVRTPREDAWWKRAQWAMEKTFSSSPARRRVGLDALAVLARYFKATEETCASCGSRCSAPSTTPPGGTMSHDR